MVANTFLQEGLLERPTALKANIPNTIFMPQIIKLKKKKSFMP